MSINVSFLDIKVVFDERIFFFFFWLDNKLQAKWDATFANLFIVLWWIINGDISIKISYDLQLLT